MSTFNVYDYKALFKEHLKTICKMVNDKQFKIDDVNECNKYNKIKRFLINEEHEYEQSYELIESNKKLYSQLKNILNLYPKETIKFLYKKADNDEITVLNYIRSHNPKSYLEDLPFTYGDLTKYYGENDKNDRVYLLKSLGISKDQNVYMCYLRKNGEKEPTHEFLYNLSKFKDENNNRLLVIKWETDKHCKRELKGWRLYLSQNLPNPGVKLNFKIFGYYAIVMRLLKPVNIRNKLTYVDMGCQILSILQKLHRVGCHADIKPDNIMYENKNGRIIYYLIDMYLSEERYKPSK